MKESHDTDSWQESDEELYESSGKLLSSLRKLMLWQDRRLCFKVNLGNEDEINSFLKYPPK